MSGSPDTPADRREEVIREFVLRFADVRGAGILHPSDLAVLDALRSLVAELADLREANETLTEDGALLDRLRVVALSEVEELRAEVERLTAEAAHFSRQTEVMFGQKVDAEAVCLTLRQALTDREREREDLLDLLHRIATSALRGKGGTPDYWIGQIEAALAAASTEKPA